MKRSLALLTVLLSLGTSVAMAASAVPAAAPKPATPSIPILVYHHVRATKGYAKSTWSWKMSVSPKVFEAQMQWLVDHGYQTVSLDAAAAILQGKDAGPAKPVVITFDDNNLTAYDLALPVLLSHGQTATYYIITNKLGNKSTIDRDRVKDLVAKGMDIQSHTDSHVVLTAVGTKRLDFELTESKRILEELTGRPVTHLAYPGTAHNKTVREHAQKAGYVTGTLMDPRNATPKDDLMKLPRIMMTDDTKLAKVLP
ncbi:MAG TPA: polysaccharide deacetylase family protein [Candidatus Peribacteria bacterium]|nr:polysaccharide deacetylase family protein [Candidatus Peribacteria bacterium]